MNEKINVMCIITDNYKQMLNTNHFKKDIITFVIIPIFLAVLLILLKVFISDNLINVLLTSSSIFAGLLLNLLLMIYSFTDKLNPRDNLPSKIEATRKSLIHELFYNISYCILLAVFMIIILILAMFNFSTFLPGIIVIVLKYIGNFFIYLLGIQFIFFLFMVLKRIHKLLSFEFDNKLKNS